MILCHPEIETIIDFSSSHIQSVVIESPSFFRYLMVDLYTQKGGEPGKFVLSDGGKTLSMSTSIEIIDNCLRFDLNTKPILNKIISSMEKHSVDEDFFLKTSQILQQVEQYIDELAFSFNCDLVYNHCSTAGLLKSVGLSLRDEYTDFLERLADYMELVREFDRDKLFVLVNIRSFFSDSHIEKFFETAFSHGYNILLLDNIGRKKLRFENRLSIDNDLCEF